MTTIPNLSSPMTDTTKLWQIVLTEIELSVSKANFLMWFKETYIQKVDEGVVYLGVPSIFIKEWLGKKFHNIILRILREANGQIRALEYVVVKDAEKRKEEPQKIAAQQQMTNSLPLNDYYINKEDNLNPRYTFDSFVVGPFNELAFAAAQAIIKNPGSTYNPLFIYGNTGYGKTHLIQAVGNQIKESHPGKKVYYLTSEKFSSDYVTSLQNNKIMTFKEKYRKYDVLILDDIQFFSNKEKSQEELFHVFNALY
jgi:chromosomal replication initiator protein